MKICMVVPEPGVKGGIASVVNGYRTSKLFEKHDIICVESYRDGSKKQKMLKAIKAYIDFAGIIRNKKIDLVHIHSSFGPSFYRKIPFILMAHGKKLPIVNHIHGAEFDSFYENASGLKKRLVRQIYNKCDRIIVLSDEWKMRISLIVPSGKIDIIENYAQIPKDYGQPSFERTGKDQCNKDQTNSAQSDTFDRITKKHSQILFMGELGYRKGCFDMPKIMREVENFGVHNKETQPDIVAGCESESTSQPCKSAECAFESLTLYMAGAGQLEELKADFEKTVPKCQVIFPGWVRGEDKDKLLRESSILLFPSYNEGMPMTVLEAMAYGLCVITTNVGGIPRLIKQRETGFIENPGNIKKMAEHLAEVIANPEECSRIGRNAREYVQKYYSLEHHIELLNECYEKCVKHS